MKHYAKCPECGSASLTWDTRTEIRGLANQGRLNTSDVQCVFFLGCDDCSETVATFGENTIAQELNSQRTTKDAS